MAGLVGCLIHKMFACSLKTLWNTYKPWSHTHWYKQPWDKHSHYMTFLALKIFQSLVLLNPCRFPGTELNKLSKINKKCCLTYTTTCDCSVNILLSALETLLKVVLFVLARRAMSYCILMSSLTVLMDKQLHYSPCRLTPGSWTGRELQQGASVAGGVEWSGKTCCSGQSLTLSKQECDESVMQQ